MHVLMKKLELSKVSKFRTETIEGDAPDMPIIGKPFYVFGKSLTEGANVRVVQTSPVKQIDSEEEGEYIISTESGSRYHLTMTNILLS